jgi:hypothetical protein
MTGPDPRRPRRYEARPIHLKASLNVLIRPGETLTLHPDGKGGFRLFTQTGKKKTWREVARSKGGAR